MSQKPKSVARRKPNSARVRRGATVVEFAVVLPVFLLVLFFFFEAWRFVQFQHAVDQAALEAARVAIVPGATAEEARDRAMLVLEPMGGGSATVNISPDPILDSTDEVTVDVSLPFSNVGLFFNYFAPSYIFSSSLTMEHENSRVGRM